MSDLKLTLSDVTSFQPYNLSGLKKIIFRPGLKTIYHHCPFRLSSFHFNKGFYNRIKISGYEPGFGNKPNEYYSKLFFVISFFTLHMQMLLSLALIRFEKEIIGQLNFF